MSRRVQEDASRLLLFFEQYSLKNFADCAQQKSDCKSLHKKLYGLMVFIAESKQHSTFSHTVFRFLDETVSDALLFIFCWAQGAYKPAKLELRCAIENMLKALLSINTPNVIREKRIYIIFDNAKSDSFFSTKFGADILDELRNQYGILCETVHSTSNDLLPLDALIFLPQYEESQSQEYSRQFVRVFDFILALLYFNFYKNIYYMHPENKKDFLDALSHSQKVKVIKEKFESP